jgi:5-methylcytosine-specific restriction endonuclease McrA
MEVKTYFKPEKVKLSKAQFKKLQHEVLERDSFTCQKCGVRTNNSPHHIIYKSQSGKDTLENMITLCGPLENNCHRKLHDHRIQIDL